MAQRYIYLSDELNQKLKKEENASGLIQNLLMMHYSEDNIRMLSKEELDLLIKKEEAKQEYENKIKELRWI